MGTQAKTGAGRFQWSMGGWFGAQIGATLWLLLLGGLMLGQGRTSGGIVLALGLLLNGLGVYLWRARDTWEPYPAIQLFLGACGVGALGAVLLASASIPSADSSSVPSLPTLLVYPALMAVFHLQETASRKSSD